jgi:hypothetical protein
LTETECARRWRGGDITQPPNAQMPKLCPDAAKPKAAHPSKLVKKVDRWSKLK